MKRWGAGLLASFAVGVAAILVQMVGLVRGERAVWVPAMVVGLAAITVVVGCSLGLAVEVWRAWRATRDSTRPQSPRPPRVG